MLRCFSLPRLAAALAALCLVTAHAQDASNSSASAVSAKEGSDASGAAPAAFAERQERSPWLLVPLVSSNPKLGTSAGAMVGYVTKFDGQSEPSLVAMQGQTSNTSSTTVALGGKAYWSANQNRLAGGLVGGKVSNDYLDFLGTGREVRSDENIQAFFVRYQREVLPHWYLGAQALYANYAVDGLDPTSDLILDMAGLTGLVSAGLGLITSYDTRDNTNNPTDGMYAQLHNLAYREGLGSDANYDALTAEMQWYATTGKNNVLVMHAKGRWTKDAPSSRQSTVQLRGYTSGQYLGRNALTLEVEDRYMIQPRWGLKAFAGISCLYGDGKSCSGDQVFPMAGGGVFFILKPEANMLVSAEFAKGNGDNQGFYLTFGHRF